MKKIKKLKNKIAVKVMLRIGVTLIFASAIFGVFCLVLYLVIRVCDLLTYLYVSAPVIEHSGWTMLSSGIVAGLLVLYGKFLLSGLKGLAFTLFVERKPVVPLILKLESKYKRYRQKVKEWCYYVRAMRLSDAVDYIGRVLCFGVMVIMGLMGIVLIIVLMLKSMFH